MEMWGGGITPNSTHTYPLYTHTYIMAIHWLPRRLRASLGCKKLTLGYLVSKGISLVSKVSCFIPSRG
jgi:hypothetical protein